MPSLKNILASTAIVAAQLAAGHSVITNAVGDAGGSGMALGVDTSTPRDGTNRRPFQQDATRFRGDSEETVGETIGAGDNDVESGTAAILAETGDSLPQISPGGELTMTLHQVNSDGAGPYTCMINDDGSAETWDEIAVTQNVEGNERGRNRDGEATDHPLVASIPADQQCTGSVAGQENVCLVRCQNPARAGPFGGVVPVQMSGGAANNTEEDPATGTSAAPATGTDASPAAGSSEAPTNSANDNAANGGNDNGNTANDADEDTANDNDDEEDEDEDEDNANADRRRAIWFSV
ncbi:hypothetical protein ACHAPT_007088 [Fusarium lateritium]